MHHVSRIAMAGSGASSVATRPIAAVSFKNKSFSESAHPLRKQSKTFMHARSSQHVTRKECRDAPCQAGCISGYAACEQQ